MGKTKDFLFICGFLYIFNFEPVEFLTCCPALIKNMAVSHACVLKLSRSLQLQETPAPSDAAALGQGLASAPACPPMFCQNKSG